MAYKMVISTKEQLVGMIEDLLNTDLDFLCKLAPGELGILATSLKDFLARGGKYFLVDYGREKGDL